MNWGKLFVGIILALILAFIDAAMATYLLSWVGLSFWHWFQIGLVFTGFVTTALSMHDFRND